MLVTNFEFGEDGFVIRLAGCHNVINDARKFVASIFDRFEAAMASPLPAIIVAEKRLLL